LFQSARWKAYLRNLQKAGEDNTDDADGNKVIYHIFHSQKIWFTQEENNGHQGVAEEHLERCDALVKDCSRMVDELEETLANTPKPSEVLDWGSLW
jgi:hypothetical protein